MNKNEYYKLLAMQYFDSLGMNYNIGSLNIGTKKFNKSLLKWLTERQITAQRYVEFLNNYGKDITTIETAEVDKGRYDSISTLYDTTIITPYYYPSESQNENNKVLKYEFFPDSINPGMLKIDYQGRLREIISAPNYIKQYITENPYRRTDILGYDELHNGGKFDIIVGMYGHIHDNDKIKKLKQLKELREKIFTNDIRVEYDCDRDSYFAAIMSDREKKYIKTKTK